jgi:hypothetical protein
LQHQQGIIRQQQYIEVIRNGTLGLLADYDQGLVVDGDVAWLCGHNHVLQALWLIQCDQGAALRQICHCEGVMHKLNGH